MRVTMEVIDIHSSRRRVRFRHNHTENDTDHCCSCGERGDGVDSGMGRTTPSCKNNHFLVLKVLPFLFVFLFILLCSSGMTIQTTNARKNDGFNGGGISNRNPFLENRRSFWSSSSSSSSSSSFSSPSSSSSSSSLSSSSVYQNGKLVYNNDNRRGAGFSEIHNNPQYARDLMRTSTSALLDNAQLTRRIYQQQQQRQQLQTNRVTTMISPEERFYNENRNNNAEDNSNNFIQTLSNNRRNANGGRRNSASRRRNTFPPRPASVNSILSLESALSVWDDSNSVCHTIPGLTREQMELCIRAPETTKVAIQGIQMATDECAHQMQTHRWNCSSLRGSVNPHKTQMFNKGYKESAFGHAIAAAGVAYAVAKACSQGKLLNCGCGFQYDDQVNYIPSKEADHAFDERNEAMLKKTSISSWKWSGCSHNMDYGMKFAKLFLDAREKSHDLPAMTNLHNNKVGRVAVSANMEVRCKCHGLSGSCEMRTCWRSPPAFRRVGEFLKNKFKRAIMIDQSELGNRPLGRVKKLNKQKRRKRRDRQNKKKHNANIDLWYYERSPTYCDSNNDKSIPGTSGRRCNVTDGREPGSCSTLCCGRGYNTIRQVYTKLCHCQFIWCCQVTCRNCTVDEWITVCK